MPDAVILTQLISLWFVLLFVITLSSGRERSELSEILKVYDAVKTVKENPTLFRQAINLQDGVRLEEEA